MSHSQQKLCLKLLTWTRVVRRFGHICLGSSAMAINWMHWAAADGLKLSVPRLPSTLFFVYNRTSSGISSHLCSYCARRLSSFVYKKFFSWTPACWRTTAELAPW